MGLYEYMMLSETEQWNVLWDKGTYLSVRIEDGKRFNLYALFAFFIEVEYDNEGNNIVGKGHFKSGDTLDKYSGNIDINKI